MSNATSSGISRAIAALALVLVGGGGGGCAAPVASAESEIQTSQTALGEAATLTFGDDFTVKVLGTLERGKKVRVAYDEDRLTACRGEQLGKPAWSITGYWKIGEGEVHAFEAGGFSPSGGSEPPVISLDAAGDLQLWFQNNNRWGCNAYDSAFGANYHFTVQPAERDPGWLGNVRTVIARQTCDGRACEGDMRPFEGELLYETYARQRAAIRAVFFEVWKEGVTDFDNPSLWEQLDVQIHSRVAGTSAFQTAYVAFDRRRGNNAGYAYDLRTLDPIPGLFTVQNAADCPAFPLSVPATGGGAYVEATVELFFTVNGVELRPAPGAHYRVRYQNYRSAYAVCVP